MSWRGRYTIHYKNEDGAKCVYTKVAENAEDAIGYLINEHNVANITLVTENGRDITSEVFD